MGILTWILVGLVAGIIAKFIMPGRDPGGFIVTILIGIAGGMLGGFIASQFDLGSVTGFDFRSLLIAVLGSLLLLFVYRRLRR
jgi:uncharacterized membrane protein YeaQ/YmgE (transglycosylase-associated protein family)